MNDFSNHTRYEEYQTSDFMSTYPMAEKSYSESGNQEPLEKEHNYGQPMYVWANDHKSITAARICQNDSSHIEQETAEAEQTVIKEPTCTEKAVFFGVRCLKIRHLKHRKKWLKNLRLVIALKMESASDVMRKSQDAG